MCFLSYLGVSFFVAGGVFGEVVIAIFADVGKSLFIAGAAFGDGGIIFGGRLNIW